MSKVVDTKRVFKFWWAWNFDKEEAWLNNMANSGYLLEDVTWMVYKFRRCEPGEYIIRVAYQNNSPDYISFMNELGAEQITYNMGWQYFKRKTEQGEFNTCMCDFLRVWVY